LGAEEKGATAIDRVGELRGKEGENKQEGEGDEKAEEKGSRVQPELAQPEGWQPKKRKMIIGKEADLVDKKMKEKGKREGGEGKKKGGRENMRGKKQLTKKQRRATYIQTQPKEMSYEELGGWFDKVGSEEEGEEATAEPQKGTRVTPTEQEEIDRAVEEKARKDKELGDQWEAEWTRKPLKPGKAKEAKEVKREGNGEIQGPEEAVQEFK
jgi:hypothetical protein